MNDGVVQVPFLEAGGLVLGPSLDVTVACVRKVVTFGVSFLVRQDAGLPSGSCFHP